MLQPEAPSEPQIASEPASPEPLRIDARHRAFILSCCSALGVDIEDVLTHGRGSIVIVEARQIIAWSLRARWRLSYPNLARLLGRNDHTTMMSSVRKVQRALDARKEWAVAGTQACGVEAQPTIELESPLETLRRCSASELSGVALR